MQLKIPKILILMVTTFTLSIFVIGLSHFGMTQHLKDQMSGCPFLPGHSSVCKMSPIEHMQELQNMFTALPEKYTPLLLSIFLGLLGLKFFRKFFELHHFQLYRYTKFSRLRNFFIFDPLKESFSRGILNPKVF